MNRHYSEADLLETYYLPPGDSMPVMMHLADCAECAARYEGLEKKLRETASCHADHPETFWTRQRVSIMRRIGEEGRRISVVAKVGRVAAAAVLSFALGGLATYKIVTHREAQSVPVTASAPAAHIAAPAPANADAPAAHDAWDTDDLQGFHSVVAWETWTDSDEGGRL